MKESSSFTGRRRRRTTGRSVAVADVISRLTITVGGIGTIVAVLGVCVFLIWVVVPLFESAEVGQGAAFDADWSGQAPIQAGVDKFQVMGWFMLPDGRAQIVRIDTGELIGEKQIFENREITSSSFLVGRPEAVFGFADGSIELLSIGFETSFPVESTIPEETRAELGRGAVGDADVDGDADGVGGAGADGHGGADRVAGGDAGGHGGAGRGAVANADIHSDAYRIAVANTDVYAVTHARHYGIADSHLDADTIFVA